MVGELRSEVDVLEEPLYIIEDYEGVFTPVGVVEDVLGELDFPKFSEARQILAGNDLYIGNIRVFR